MPSVMDYTTNPLQQLRELQGHLRGHSGADLRRAGLRGLKALGLINHEGDAVRLSQAMQAMPGPFPRGRIDENQVEDWLEYIKSFPLDPVGMGEDRLQGPEFSVYPSGRRCGSSWITLARETATANASARTTDTFTLELDFPIDDVILWMETGQGVVDEITLIEVDGIEYYLGMVDYLGTLVCDLETEPHPQRAGIAIPCIEKKLTVTVGLKPFSQDITWKVYADCFPRRGGKAAKLNFLGLAPPSRG